MTGDFITVARASGGKVLTKTIRRGDGGELAINKFDDVKFMKFTTHPVSSFEQMCAVLSKIDRHSCVIRGRPLVEGESVRRLLRDDPQTGNKATVAPAEHHWVLVDVDKLPWDGNAARDPQGAVRHIRQSVLPELGDTQVWWSLTSSAGIRPGISMRIAFWSDMPLTDGQLQAMFAGRDHIDPSVFRAEQPIYLASPVLAPGVDDPVEGGWLNRMGTEGFGGDTLRLAGGVDEEGADHAEAQLEKFTKEVAKAQEGNRQRTLYGRSKDMGRMVGAGWIAAEVVREKLIDAGRKSGLPTDEVLETVTRAIEEGRHMSPPDLASSLTFDDFAGLKIIEGGEEVIWEWPNGMRFNAGEVFDQKPFLKKLLSRPDGTAYMLASPPVWVRRLRTAKANATRAQAYPEDTPKEMLRQHLAEWTSAWTRGVSRTRREDILAGNPFFDEELSAWLFRMDDFRALLTDRKTQFAGLSAIELGRRLVELGGTRRTTTIQGKSYGVYRVPDAEVTKIASLLPHDLPEEPI